jgi:vitamin B12 transporter
MLTRSQWIIFLLLVFHLPVHALLAQEEPVELPPVVVTATATPKPMDEVVSTITVVTREEIEARGKEDLDEVLREVPGVDVVRTGGPGGRASLLIRGGNDDHVLVLVDGIEVNDPIEFGRSFDAGLLALDDIDRIEVLRGPQSALYGSDAMSGVVQVFTRRGSGPPTGRVRLDYGSFGTFRESAEVSGSVPKLDFSLSLSNFETQGISAATKDDGNQERDGYRNLSLAGRFGYHPTADTELGLIFRAFDAVSALDNFGGPGGDDPNFILTTRRSFIRAYLDRWLCQGRWHPTVSADYADHRRVLDNDPDPAHPRDREDGTFRGDLWKLAWRNEFYLGDHHLVTLGTEYEEEIGESKDTFISGFGTFRSKFPEKTALTRSGFVQEDFHLRGFGAVAGARWDSHDRFGEHVSGRAGATYKLEATATRFRTAWGTGFKAPSLFQLYSSYGDPRLAPEQSESWEAGIEQDFLDGRLGFSLTHFDLIFEDLIDFNLSTNRYQNLSGATSRGWEVGAQSHLIEPLRVSLAYTTVDARDQKTGKPLIRRSGDKYSASVEWNPLQVLNLDLLALHVGERDDLDFVSGRRVQLHPYTLVDLAVNWRVKPAWKLSLRAENLFNADYQEAFGFGSPGQSFYAGISYEFSLRRKAG